MTLQTEIMQTYKLKPFSCSWSSKSSFFKRKSFFHGYVTKTTWWWIESIVAHQFSSLTISQCIHLNTCECFDLFSFNLVQFMYIGAIHNTWHLEALYRDNSISSYRLVSIKEVQVDCFNFLLDSLLLDQHVASVGHLHQQSVMPNMHAATVGRKKVHHSHMLLLSPWDTVFRLLYSVSFPASNHIIIIIIIFIIVKTR